MPNGGPHALTEHRAYIEQWYQVGSPEGFGAGELAVAEIRARIGFVADDEQLFDDSEGYAPMRPSRRAPLNEWGVELNPGTATPWLEDPDWGLPVESGSSLPRKNPRCGG